MRSRRRNSVSPVGVVMMLVGLVVVRAQGWPTWTLVVVAVLAFAASLLVPWLRGRLWTSRD